MSYLETIGAEKFTTYRFEVIKSTSRGIQLRCTDASAFEAFAYFSLPVGSTAFASIQKVRYFTDAPEILVTIESVISYAEIPTFAKSSYWESREVA